MVVCDETPERCRVDRTDWLGHDLLDVDAGALIALPLA
jgi:hypothetical protein